VHANPGLHRQSSGLLAPGGDQVGKGHASWLAPPARQKKLAGHRVHSVPLPRKPASHWHREVSRAELAGQAVVSVALAGQVLQGVQVVAPSAVEKVPGAHAAQALADAAEDQVPPAHGRQVVAPAII